VTPAYPQLAIPGGLATGAEPLHQEEFLDLTGWSSGQHAILQDKLLWSFESGEKLPTKLLKLFRLNGYTALGDDQARDTLGPQIIGKAKYRAVRNAGMFQNDFFHFSSMHVLTARYNHVFLAAADRKIAVLVQASEIASVHPPIAERLRRFLLVVENIPSPHLVSGR
jgi:hypothetical protein